MEGKYIILIMVLLVVLMFVGAMSYDFYINKFVYHAPGY